MTRTNTRAGFTLIELLVAMAIITTLAGFILLVYPGARDQDRARNAVSDVEITLRMAQGMAARDKAPRGVRFIPDRTDKTDPRFVTELQYVELPPPLIPNLKPLTPSAQNPTANPANEPRVRFEYTLVTGTGPTAGTIIERKCFIDNLTLEQADQIAPNCTIVMPVFGSWHKIIGPPSPNAFNPIRTGPNAGLYSVQVALEVFPDAIMGGGTQAVTHHFAIYLSATPLVGEPTVLLPKNICVDMSMGLPKMPATVAPALPAAFDVIFGPDGKLIENPNGVVLLWVRDYTKVPSMNVTPGLGLIDAFRRGGDQYIISVRSSGAIGHNQPYWPNVNDGTYATGQDAFTLVRQELNN